MSLARHLARLSACLLAVMTVMVVAGFGVSAARAHDGHTHRPAAHVQAVHATAADGPAAATATVISAKAISAKAISAKPVSPETLQPGSDAPDACGLCCNQCMTCCHSVLMPASAAALTPSGLPSRITATHTARPSGLAPEALRRPPRTRA